MILSAGITQIKFVTVYSQNNRLLESIEHRFMLYVTWYLGLDLWMLRCYTTSWLFGRTLSIGRAVENESLVSLNIERKRDRLRRKSCARRNVEGAKNRETFPP